MGSKSLEHVVGRRWRGVAARGTFGARRRSTGRRELWRRCWAGQRRGRRQHRGGACRSGTSRIDAVRGRRGDGRSRVGDWLCDREMRIARRRCRRGKRRCFVTASNERADRKDTEGDCEQNDGSQCERKNRSFVGENGLRARPTSIRQTRAAKRKGSAGTRRARVLLEVRVTDVRGGVSIRTRRIGALERSKRTRGRRRRMRRCIGDGAHRRNGRQGQRDDPQLGQKIKASGSRDLR